MMQMKPRHNWLIVLRVLSAGLIGLVLSGCQIRVGRNPGFSVGEVKLASKDAGSVGATPTTPPASPAAMRATDSETKQLPQILYTVKHRESPSSGRRAVVTDLYRVKISGEHARLVFTDRDEPWMIQSIDGVMPNNRILLTVAESDEQALLPNTKLVTVSTDGTGASTTVNDQFIAPFLPEVNRDGQRLAVVQFDSTNDGSVFQLVTMKLDGTQQKTLLQSEQALTSLVWNRAGTRIAFFRPLKSGQTAIETIAVQTGAVEQVSSFDGQGMGLDWGSNGTFAVLTQTSDQRNHLIIIDQQGKLIQTIPGDVFVTPQFSPDAQSLASVTFSEQQRSSQTMPVGSIQLTRLSSPRRQSDGSELAQGFGGSDAAVSPAVLTDQTVDNLGEASAIVGWLP